MLPIDNKTARTFIWKEGIDPELIKWKTLVAFSWKLKNNQAGNGYIEMGEFDLNPRTFSSQYVAAIAKQGYEGYFKDADSNSH